MRHSGIVHTQQRESSCSDDFELHVLVLLFSRRAEYLSRYIIAVSIL